MTCRVAWPSAAAQIWAYALTWMVIATSALGCQGPPAVSSRMVATAAAPTPAPGLHEGDAVLPDYRFRNGEVLPSLRVHYGTRGTPKRDKGGRIVNAVLVQHWTSASGAALQTPEFEGALYGPGCPLDAAKYFLVFVDNVGHGRSSKPSDGLHARFPHYGYRDMVDLQHHVVHEVLGIARLHAFVGLSMGGMNAWLWAETYPDEVGGILPIVSLPQRIAGRNLLWRRIVTRAIREDPEWNGGEYTHPPRGWVEAFPLFRMMLDGVPHLQAVVADAPAADRFLGDARSQAEGMDANDVLYSLESSSDYAPEAALGNVRAKVTVLNFGDDEFNPIALDALGRLARSLPQARVIVQPGTPSSFGHLTQAHPSLWSKHVATFIQELGEP